MATDSHSEQRAAEPIRAVFDSNIYVAAYLSKNARSPNKELFRRWRNGEFVLLVSQAILEEVIEKFDQRSIDQALTMELVAFVLADAEYVVTPVAEIPTIIVGDADDDQVLACAITGQANYLVTYDPHFDSLGGEYQGIRVLDGLHFLYVVRGDTKPSR
ncbi:MAG: putative toxin-antitoxin system toxin component, PIN family [Anaerolineae bacterium]